MRDVDFLRVLIDETDDCPYLPNEVARMPLAVATQPINGARMDKLLELGYRRSGSFFYRTQCPRCSACEALRLDVQTFRPSRSQRRVEKRGDSRLQVRIGKPETDEYRVHLFNLHRRARGLDRSGATADETDYNSFLLNAPCESLELSLWDQGQLIAVSITDVASSGLSAVYCFFDPDASIYSPGTYAILKQLQIARHLGLRWLYLGLYVEANAHLNYKAKFRPHQRLIRGVWNNFY